MMTLEGGKDWGLDASLRIPGTLRTTQMMACFAHGGFSQERGTAFMACPPDSLGLYSSIQVFAG